MLPVVAVAVVSIDTTIVVVVAAAAAAAMEADAMTIVEALATTLMTAASMAADVIVKKDMDLETSIAMQALAAMTATVVVATTDVVVAAEAATTIAAMIVAQIAAQIAADTMLLLVEMMLANPTVVVVEITVPVRIVTPDNLARLCHRISTAVLCRPLLSFFTLPCFGHSNYRAIFDSTPVFQKACSQCLTGDASRISASAMTNSSALFSMSNSVSFSGFGKDIKIADNPSALVNMYCASECFSSSIHSKTARDISRAVFHISAR